MSTTFTLDTATDRAHPTPRVMRRLTPPTIRARKKDGAIDRPLVMLTAYTVRMAQLLDPHCDILLVGDSLGNVIYGFDSTLPVSLEMMIAHGGAVVRGSYHSVVIVDMPFGSYEASAEHAIRSATRVLKETGCAGIKLEGGEAMAETVAFLSARGIPVMGHVGLTPQAVNMLGGHKVQGKGEAAAAKVLADARAVAEAGAFAMVIEGVVEPVAIDVTRAVPCPVIGIGASAQCDGQVLVSEDMLGMFELVPRFVRRFDELGKRIGAAAEAYAAAVRAREFPGAEQIYAP
ncbi:MAG: 3-methyl-2-oxobutanoate hydroxymethyltransferase [Sphingomonadaceae bacterium]|nr:3-methyl-2-oxobutanoate hydroxymethyltransferase [Sphingomonadaceae bacterium]